MLRLLYASCFILVREPVSGGNVSRSCGVWGARGSLREGNQHTGTVRAPSPPGFRPEGAQGCSHGWSAAQRAKRNPWEVVCHESAPGGTAGSQEPRAPSGAQSTEPLFSMGSACCARSTRGYSPLPHPGLKHHDTPTIEEEPARVKEERHPHPSPLPEGEGAGESVHVGRGTQGRISLRCQYRCRVRAEENRATGGRGPQSQHQRLW